MQYEGEREQTLALAQVAKLPGSVRDASTIGLRIRFSDGQATVSLGAGDSVCWTRCILSASRASAEALAALTTRPDPQGALLVGCSGPQ
jgi:hypothetical protein